MSATPVVDLDTVAEFTVTDTQGNELTYNLTQELAISQATLQNDMYQHPAKYAYWAALYNAVQRKRREAEANFEVVRATLSNKARADIKAETGKPATAGAVTDAIIPEEEYQEAQRAVSDWELKEDELKYLMKAFDHRLSMLQQLSANSRKDMENNIAY